MRFRPDGSLRRTGGGRVVFGGSPLRMWRLTPAGAALVDRAVLGEDLDVTAPAVGALVDRLVDAGALHPEPRPGAPGAPDPAEVTVVVPVRDRVAGLARLLDSLEPDRRDGVQVVVVDDGSADAAGHALVAASHGATLVRRGRSGGPAAAREAGIAVATTAVVAVVDSDCVVTDGWLRPLLAHLADERVAAAAPRIATAGGTGALARYDALRSPLDLGGEPARVSPGTRVSYVPSAALVLRRDAHAAVGGFDPELQVGEDVDLVWRLVGSGRTVRYEPASVVEHGPRPDLAGWLGQRFAYGGSAALLDRRHPWQVAPVRCSPWSAGGWVAVAAGHPVLGAAVLAGSAAALPRRLGSPASGVPTADALRLAALGHLGAGQQLARAVVRAWWPAALPAALVSRRVRRVVAASVASVAVAAAVQARRRDPSLGPASLASVAGLAVLDDAAYGAGVWAGCARAGSGRALLPVLPQRAHRL
ncbi:mycofactocin biosynthesis glycosyltransferase MftF [Dermatobacter hominis]|uniref:mycofactocin biosynthesis glycosyltransferase MftF n=1 Tax=Dermatobacter hominis TaxID=2884263 RepID=UPI001D12EF10|nr:mycofactocin biosynthesis glycosyltransferase MftF [Dermatobacter hominis]UDY37758.1 mycofactocin biosynthesis glycosyltransferase MftF [Dermatobacter hominis]